MTVSLWPLAASGIPYKALIWMEMRPARREIRCLHKERSFSGQTGPCRRGHRGTPSPWSPHHPGTPVQLSASEGRDTAFLVCTKVMPCGWHNLVQVSKLK